MLKVTFTLWILKKISIGKVERKLMQPSCSGHYISGECNSVVCSVCDSRSAGAPGCLVRAPSRSSAAENWSDTSCARPADRHTERSTCAALTFCRGDPTLFQEGNHPPCLLTELEVLCKKIVFLHLVNLQTCWSVCTHCHDTYVVALARSYPLMSELLTRRSPIYYFSLE